MPRDDEALEAAADAHAAADSEDDSDGDEDEDEDEDGDAAMDDDGAAAAAADGGDDDDDSDDWEDEDGTAARPMDGDTQVVGAGDEARLLAALSGPGGEQGLEDEERDAVDLGDEEVLPTDEVVLVATADEDFCGLEVQVRARGRTEGGS